MRLRYFFIFTAFVLMVFSCSVLAFAADAVYLPVLDLNDYPDFPTTFPYRLGTTGSTTSISLPAWASSLLNDLSNTAGIDYLSGDSSRPYNVSIRYFRESDSSTVSFGTLDNTKYFNSISYIHYSGDASSSYYSISVRSLPNVGYTYLFVNKISTSYNYSSNSVPILDILGYYPNAYYLYSYGVSSVDDYISSTPNYSSFADAFLAAQNLYNSGTSEPGVYRFSVPCSNVAYLRGTGTLKLYTRFSTNSSLVSFGGGWWPSNQDYSTVSSLPVSGSAISSNSNIHWDKDPSVETGLFGVTKYAFKEYSVSSNSSYRRIFNPLVYTTNISSTTLAADQTYNSTIDCVFVGVLDELVIYPVSSDVVISSSGASYTGDSTSGYENSYSPVLDSSSGSIPVGNIVFKNDLTGELSSPVSGGTSSYNPDGVVLHDIDEQVNITLNNGFSNLGNLLNVPRSFIGNILTPFNDFFGLFGSFFDWMPEEVSSVWKSSLAILPIVGIVKFFF